MYPGTCGARIAVRLAAIAESAIGGPDSGSAGNAPAVDVLIVLVWGGTRGRSCCLSGLCLIFGLFHARLGRGYHDTGYHQ